MSANGSELHDTFALGDHEKVKLATWLAEHDVTCPYVQNCGAIGGRLCVTFSPTSVGSIASASCVCRPDAEVILTDFEQF